MKQLTKLKDEKSTDRKLKTREAILDAAGKKLKKDGFNGAGVDGLASAAGVTSGAFYAHFSNKEDLLKEVISTYLGAPYVHENAESQEAKEKQLKEFLKIYMSPDHCGDPEDGCVMPTLSADVSRASSGVRKVYQERMIQLIEKMSKVVHGSPAKKRKQAWSVLAMMIGAVTIGRALPEGEESEVLMEAAFENAMSMLK